MRGKFEVLPFLSTKKMLHPCAFVCGVVVLIRKSQKSVLRGESFRDVQ